MNTLKENPNTSNMSPSASPKADDSNPSGATRPPKTPLKKEELEKIAKQLKKKLSKASIAAKQLLSPTKTTTPRSSPLKSFLARRDLSSSPPFSLPIPGKSPTLTKTPATHFLLSSPLKNMTSLSERDALESPTKRRNSTRASLMSLATPDEYLDRDQGIRTQTDSGPEFAVTKAGEPQMTLHHISLPKTPQKSFASILKPLPALQTTPKQRRSSNTVGFVRTPTQPSNDNEGADLLMYLATSPSPAQPAPPFTPRSAAQAAAAQQQQHQQAVNGGGSGGGPLPSSKPTMFVVPAPPLTPKRPTITSSRTPQNRLTPLVNLFNGGGATSGGLPSSGMMLTPAGFNMNDYINFFLPLPGMNQQNKNFIKTPDLQVHKQKVDGKMINFDKVGLFNGDQRADDS